VNKLTDSINGLFSRATWVTVNPFMFACSLFREFRELNETVKLKGVNIVTVATSVGITRVLDMCGLNSPK